MQMVADELESTLRVVERLRSFDDASVSARPAAESWSKKEILGHLIDSAANNHQRFVRLQLGGRLELAGYEQDGWVRVQHYQDRRWEELVELWHVYNSHLAHLIRNVDINCLPHLWRDPQGNDVTLEFIMRDYVVHMRHHLDQILE